MEIVAYSQSNGYAYAINGQSGLLAQSPWGISPPGSPSPGSAARTST